MPPDQGLPGDRECLEHMLQAARDALTIGSGKQRADLDRDMVFRRALVNCVQEIGEAAARTSDASRARAAAVPWGHIVATRHILVHAYYRIDLDILWEILSQDLPTLVAGLEAALSAWPAHQSD